MILVELKGSSTIGGPCPAKNGPLGSVRCNTHIDQARDLNGVLQCSFEGKAANWCPKCDAHVVWENGQWALSQVAGSHISINRIERQTPAGLKVIHWVSSGDLQDADDICMKSWSEEAPIPCYYLGAWADSCDFLGKNHHMAVDQREEPQRHFFVFNFVPKTLADVEKALAEWAA